MSQSSTKKRSTLLRNSSSTPDAISNKKQKLAGNTNPVFQGTLYWNGDEEHVIITEHKQTVKIMGIEVEVHGDGTPGNIRLVQVIRTDNKEEKYQQVVAGIENELNYRREDMEHHKEKRLELNQSLEHQADMDEAEMEELHDQVKQSSLIVRNHTLNIVKVLRETTVQVNYNKTYSHGLTVALVPGQLSRVSFLPKAVCWYPHGMTMERPTVPLDKSLPVVQVNENISEQVPFGLGDSECEWISDPISGTNRDTSLSKQEKKKKLMEYTEAAMAGNSYGQFLLGKCYQLNLLDVGVDEKKAVQLYTLSADQCNAWAQTVLGDSYKYGLTGVDRDSKKAVELYRMAVEQGHARAQIALAECYEFGRGVEEDWKIAFDLYTLAANQGFPDGQFGLSECYIAGIGVIKDMEKAVEFNTLAAKQGHHDAQYHLGIYYFNMGLDKDLAKHWLLKAAVGNDEDVQEYARFSLRDSFNIRIESD